MFLKIFLLILIFCYVRCVSSSEELELELEAGHGKPTSALFSKDTVKQAYEQDKLGIIAAMVDALQSNDEVLNVTLVGTQNVHGPNGDVLEVRTVELHIPQIIKQMDVIEIVTVDDDEDDTTIEELKKIFIKVSKIGFDIELLMQELDEDGDVVEEAYFDKDTRYSYSGGMNQINETIKVANRKVVEDKIKELKSENQLTAVLRFDDKGTFLSKESTVLPELMVSVVSEDSDPETKFIDEAQRGLVIISLKYQHNESEIPKRLSEYLKLKFADYDFYVFENEPDSWYITKDFKISLKYEFTGWDEDDIYYTVFGVKKEDASTTTVEE